MANLTEEQINQLGEVGKGLFNASVELSRDFPELLAKAKKGTEEICELLRQRQAGAKEPELKKMLRETHNAQVSLLDMVFDIATSALKLPGLMSEAADKAKIAALQDSTLKNKAPVEVLANIKASMKFDPFLKQFSIAGAIFPTSSVIDDFINTNQAFLQRSAGSLDVRGRIERVLRTFVKDVASLPLPPFFDTFKAILTELTKSQMRKDIEKLRAETGERLYLLRRLQTDIEHEINFATSMIESSTRGGIEAAENEQKVLAQYEALQPPAA